MKLRLSQQNHSIDVELISSSPFIIKIDEQEYQPDICKISENLYSLILNNQSYFLSFNEKDNQKFISDLLHENIINVQSELEITLSKFGFASTEIEKVGEIHALIPGLITKLFVKVGDQIKDGHPLCILEAMKMENEINAPINGIVKMIHVSEGNSVEKGSLIMEVE
jgi:biotin carboxyl carrier protein